MTDLVALERVLLDAGLAPATRARYLKTAERIGDQDPVSWFRSQLRRGLATNTLLGLRAAAKYVIVVQRGVAVRQADLLLPAAKGKTGLAREGLTPAQRGTYADAVASVRAPERFVLLLLPLTGLRIEEAVMLRWDDVQRKGDRYLLHVREGKGRKARVVPLSRKALTVIAEARRCARARPVASAWAFPTARGGPVSQDRVRRALKDALSARKGMDGVVPHTLRHTFATTLARRGASLERIQALMGHADIKSTARYLHPTIADLGAAVDLLDD